MSDEQSIAAEYVRRIREGEQNPFRTIEALGEHIGALWGALAKTGVEVWDAEEKAKGRNTRPHGEPGTMLYHLRAVDEYQKKCFQYFAVLLPDVKDAADGDTKAEERMQEPLKALEQRHQAEWDEMRRRSVLINTQSQKD